MGLLIRDGFTLDGLIPARAGLYGECRFTYRPALPERVAEYLRLEAGPDPKEAAKKELANTIKILEEHLVGWQEGDGKPTEADLRRVPYPALQVMLNHVTGYSATDWVGKEKN